MRSHGWFLQARSHIYYIEGPWCAWFRGLLDSEDDKEEQIDGGLLPEMYYKEFGLANVDK